MGDFVRAAFDTRGIAVSARHSGLHGRQVTQIARTPRHPRLVSNHRPRSAGRNRRRSGAPAVVTAIPPPKPGASLAEKLAELGLTVDFHRALALRAWALTRYPGCFELDVLVCDTEANLLVPVARRGPGSVWRRATMTPCQVIGVHDDGAASLTAHAQELLRAADLVIGAPISYALSRRCCRDRPTARRRTVASASWRLGSRSVEHRAASGGARHRRSTLLWYRRWFDRRAGARAGPGRADSVQRAIGRSRLGLPWQDAKLISVHAADAGEWAPGAATITVLAPLARAIVARYDLLFCLTSPANDPARIARLLLAAGLGEAISPDVATRLNAPDRRYSPISRQRRWRSEPFLRPMYWCCAASRRAHHAHGSASRTANTPSASRNRVCSPSSKCAPSRSPSCASIPPPWCGTSAPAPARSVSKRRCCARTAMSTPSRKPGRQRQRPRQRPPFRHFQLHPGHGSGAGATGNLARSRRGVHWRFKWCLTALIEQCLARLRPGGRLVINVVTFENLASAMAAARSSGLRWEVLQLSAARSRPILQLHRLAAQNPVWIVVITKEFT